MNPDGQLLRDSMIPISHAVGVDETIADTWRTMHVLGVHHLPVVEDEIVVGMLSDREIGIVYEHGRRDPLTILAGDVMATDPYVVSIEEEFMSVVRAMAERRADCCAVLDEGRLVGILTATDAMLSLSRMLSERADLEVCDLRPSEVRSRILGEHALLRAMYRRVEDHAHRALRGDAAVESLLRERCRDLFQTLLRHIELENTLLVPTLVDTDAFGPVLADELRAEHDRQREALLAAVASVDERSAAQLAEDTLQLLDALRADMDHEEATLLDRDLLKDDPIAPDAD